MRVIAVGVEPVGIVAIGANATGVIAIGQLATGVIAIGQLARGGFVVGQLSLGVVSIGQLSVGVAWAAGQIGIGGTAGPGAIAGIFGRLFGWRFLGRESGASWPHPPFSRRRVVVGACLVAALGALWWIGAGYWVTDAVTRTGGIFVDPPRVLR